MTTIVVTHEDNEVDQFTFDSRVQVITIGRRSTNDVCIPNLSVSGTHASITIDGDSVAIEDNSSTNGTYVNGRLISRQLLNDTDEVVIGRSTVVVHHTVATQTATQTRQDITPAKPANDQPPVLGNEPALDDDIDADDSYANNDMPDQFDDQNMSLSEKAKLALGRDSTRGSGSSPRTGINGDSGLGLAAGAVGGVATSAVAGRRYTDDDVAVAEATTAESHTTAEKAHPLDGIEDDMRQANSSEPLEAEFSADTQISKPAGAVIEIQNGAKSGQVLPIDKPVTTLGRPGIQIAAIMRKPDGYFLMHIESDDTVEMPMLNSDRIGDDPVMLQSGDRLNVAGIDVEFMLS